MGRARADAHGIANPHQEGLAPQGHAPFPGGDVVELFGEVVAVEERLRPRRHGGLGQGLGRIAVDGRMHQLPDLGAVLGEIGNDRPVGLK